MVEKELIPTPTLTRSEAWDVIMSRVRQIEERVIRPVRIGLLPKTVALFRVAAGKELGDVYNVDDRGRDKIDTCCTRDLELIRIKLALEYGIDLKKSREERTHVLNKELNGIKRTDLIYRTRVEGMFYRESIEYSIDSGGIIGLSAAVIDNAHAFALNIRGFERSSSSRRRLVAA